MTLECTTAANACLNVARAAHEHPDHAHRERRRSWPTSGAASPTMATNDPIWRASDGSMTPLRIAS